MKADEAAVGSESEPLPPIITISSDRCQIDGGPLGRTVANPTRATDVPESLQTLASTLADYLSDTILDHETLSTACILDALASPDITLVGSATAHSSASAAHARKALVLISLLS